MTQIVTATFKDKLACEGALRKLEDIGIGQDHVSIVATDSAHNHFLIKEDTKADEGAIAGAAIGGVAGTLLSIATSAGFMLVPGLNLVVAGPLVAAFAGLGAGAVTGGVLGGLIGAGIPEHEAKLYEKEISGGGVLMAVETADGQKDRVRETLKAADADNINTVH